MSGDRHDMSDAEWEVLHSVLPRKHQGPERMHDRRVMNGIFFVLRTAIPARRGATSRSVTARTRPAATAATG